MCEAAGQEVETGEFLCLLLWIQAGPPVHGIGWLLLCQLTQSRNALTDPLRDSPKKEGLDPVGGQSAHRQDWFFLTLSGEGSDATACMWRAEGHVWKSVPSVHHVGSRG